MPLTIFEDRVLARVAVQAVGRSQAAGAGQGADRAVGEALGALRELGAVITPWTLRALQDDVAGLLGRSAGTGPACTPGSMPDLAPALDRLG